MAKGQENGTTILLGLKDYKVGEVVGGEDKVSQNVIPENADFVNS